MLVFTCTAARRKEIIMTIIELGLAYIIWDQVDKYVAAKTTAGQSVLSYILSKIGL